ncbi:DUF4097 family beta strand repeat-containing protein [Flavobacteriaceae bacterium 14752]|uniref:DUF4097 family beta strand repeat-containing protein n=1 Tax=Mesohalobacter salilacus TaxID=2491711 RepID=UPI000F6374CC|nr:hypothetical protein EIG84_01425 [Flavobacteriaceae bacterium 14752]
MTILNRLFILIALAFSIQKAYPQFKTAFEIKNNDIKVVWFQAYQVSKIEIKTHKSSFFKFNSSAESTYKTDLYFDYRIQNDTLIIKSIYPKALEYGDNKMTSMQEFSVSVNFSLPQQSKLIIDSDLASVFGEGQFDNFQLNTKSGHCELKRFIGNANINSYSGSITIHTRNANVKAFSQNGDLKVDQFYNKKHQINLKTVNGDIIVRQME